VSQSKGDEGGEATRDEKNREKASEIEEGDTGEVGNGCR
jgi:hypothetical protein